MRPCQRAVHEAVPDEFYRYDHQGPSDEFEKQSFGNFFNPEHPKIDRQCGREHQKERDKGALHIDLPQPNIGDQFYGVAVGEGNDRSADEDRFLQLQWQGENLPRRATVVADETGEAGDGRPEQSPACIDRFLGQISPLGEHPQGKNPTHQANQNGDHPFNDQMCRHTANRHPQRHSYGGDF